MYNPNEKPRLNHFILWCKGWYKPIKKDMDFFEQVRLILTLDEYNKYIVSVGGQPYYQHKLINDINKYVDLYELDINTAILLSYRDFIAFDISNKHITLSAPNYNRKLYKMGFIGEYKNGQSYTENNRYAKKHFSK